jgi:hypothetical protein
MVEMDADTLFDNYLQEVLKYNQKVSANVALHVRENATKKEIQAATVRMPLLLHPDKGAFRNWVEEHHHEVDPLIKESAIRKSEQFWTKWQAFREKMISQDEGWYQQVRPCMHCNCCVPVIGHNHTIWLTSDANMLFSVWHCRPSWTTSLMSELTPTEHMMP